MSNLNYRAIRDHFVHGIAGAPAYATTVTVSTDGWVSLIHHGTTIAEYKQGEWDETLTITNGGYTSRTTMGRLHCILTPRVKLGIRRGEAHINFVPWDGKPVNPFKFVKEHQK